MKKLISILLTLLLCLSLGCCSGKDKTEDYLIEVGTWKSTSETAHKYVFNQDYTGMFINSDDLNRSNFTWSYDPQYQKLSLTYSNGTWDYQVKATKEKLTLIDGGINFEYVPGIPVPTQLPSEGTYPTELVGDLIWNASENQTGSFRKYDDDYWELFADGTGLWHEDVWADTRVKWIVDDQNRLYIGRVYKDGAFEVHWYTYQPTTDGFTFTNINTDEVITTIKRK